MTHEEFANLVADMCHAQKEWLRTKSEPALSKVRSLEKQVDLVLLKLVQQPELF